MCGRQIYEYACGCTETRGRSRNQRFAFLRLSKSICTAHGYLCSVVNDLVDWKSLNLAVFYIHGCNIKSTTIFRPFDFLTIWYSVFRGAPRQRESWHNTLMMNIFIQGIPSPALTPTCNFATSINPTDCPNRKNFSVLNLISSYLFWVSYYLQPHFGLSVRIAIVNLASSKYT